MILPKEPQSPRAVALHYDELDPYYRKVWGEHLHHGLWESGKEKVEEAVLQLIDLVARCAHLVPGNTVCDVGAGYGATSRYLAKQYHANVTAITLSKMQYEYALNVDPLATNPKYVWADWLHNELAENQFDTVIAIESSEHMEDKSAFFAEAFRVLKPEGRLVVCAWLATENPRKWETDFLLEPICREGRLPGMGTKADYIQWMQAAGFRSLAFEELSRQVKKTWSASIWNLAKCMVTDKETRRFLLESFSENKIFVKTVFRLWTAYLTGSMQYGIFTGQKGHPS